MFQKIVRKIMLKKSWKIKIIKVLKNYVCKSFRKIIFQKSVIE
jgi:hypothetical protein